MNLSLDRSRKRALLSWLFAAALFVLCGVLGVLQYRWIGTVSLAQRDRLQSSLQANLNHLSRDFNAALNDACRSLLPAGSQPDDPLPENAFRTAYVRAKIAGQAPMFQRIALAVPQDDGLLLRLFDPAAETFSPAAWPSAWRAIQQRIESRLPQNFPDGPRPDPEPPPGTVFEVPLFPAGQAGARETGWLLFEVNPQYLFEILLPDLLRRHLGDSGSADYDVQIVAQSRTPSVLYHSDPDGGAESFASTADASVSLFDIQYDQLLRRRDRPPPRAAAPAIGRWQMYVRRRNGSLEAVVSRARRRNLAVTVGVLLLLLAGIAALVYHTRQAQRLAALQMDFVAGISHELRTPLAVIQTAAYNLREGLARTPAQVERYGALIQKESLRLKELVEQALRFAGARAGRVVRQAEPLSVETVIEETVASARATVQGARCQVEKSIGPGLPLVLGDPLALQHALENLIGNAAKYGTETSNWIGVSAVQAVRNQQPVIEIRVADRGPGIPLAEQPRIFDPFFRGQRAVLDQIHGTGLGLSLVKDIVEAHGGSIEVHSQPGQGAEFVVRIPVAPAEYQDEFAHSLG